MLIQVKKIVRCPGSAPFAQIETTFGRTAVRWCGGLDASEGPRHVEWTIDEEISWGRNAEPAGEAAPGVKTAGHGVMLRGRVSLTADGAAVLDLDGTQILLDLADPLPAAVDGTWIELCLAREKIALYPCEL